MYSILNTIHSPADLKGLSPEQRRNLCQEIRNFLIDSVSKTGGHLASNLGIVELTVALHTVFHSPEDKIVWDVGHQAYVHKILTGRMNSFSTLRQSGGLSGFPKRSESPYDVFDTGHSSTSISAALGIARARDLSGGNYNVISVFGDGALTGGMMYEALNDAGHSKTPLILILNDNAMSISKNVGSISKYLRNLRLQPSYFRSKKAVENALNKIPLLGKSTAQFIRSIKRVIRRIAIPTTLFDDLGFEYIGPIDGHDTEQMIQIFHSIKNLKKPVFLHIHTKKGKGYAFAEEHPDLYHGVSHFDKATGIKASKTDDYSAVFGQTLVSIAKSNPKVVGITGAMPDSTGMAEFAQKFKSRFFDVGIAEQHGVTLAAGFAVGGYTPVIPLYSSFLQRAYDQLLHDVCLQNLHVVFPVDRAGLVGRDGETHQGIYDIGFLCEMPNMSVLAPSCFTQLKEMLFYAINQHTGPIAIRYPRGSSQCTLPNQPFQYGKAFITEAGKNVTLITIGTLLKIAQEVGQALAASGYSCEIMTLPTIKPFDEATVAASAMKTGFVVTIEDNPPWGGIGEMVGYTLKKYNIDCEFKAFTLPDTPIPHGSVDELMKQYGLDSKTVSEYILGRLNA